MKFLCIFTSIILLSIMATFSAFSQGYEIKISINNKNDTVLLGYYFAKKEVHRIKNTCVLNKSGQGIFKGEEKLPKGLYFLAMNGQLLSEFIVGDEQTFEIKIDTDNLENKTTVKGSRNNEIFFDYQQMSHKAGLRQRDLQKELETADSINKIRIYEEFRTLNTEHVNVFWKIIEENKSLYISKYLNAQFLPMNMRVPAVNPSPWQEALPDDVATWTRDSLNRYQYNWWREHFFDNLNIYDPDMLRTPLYEEKITEYMSKVIPLHIDSICAEADRILDKVKDNEEIFRCILAILYNYYSPGEGKFLIYENIWTHIVDKWYIPFAKWNTEESIENMKKDVEKKKPTLIGNYAPPMEMLVVLPTDHFKAAALDTTIKNDLYAGIIIDDFRKDLLKSKFTILLFWEFTCSHCKHAIQELYDLWEENKDKGLQVITVQTYLTDEIKRDKGKWIDFINEKNFFGPGWINAWSPYSHKFREYYMGIAVPVMYLLDENGIIIFRNIGIETLKGFFEHQTDVN